MVSSGERHQTPDIDGMLGEATSLHEAGRVAEAEAICRNALIQDPNNFRAALLLSTISLQVGEAERSLEFAHIAAGREPGSAEARSNAATALHVLHRYDEAIAEYELAIGLDGDFPEAHYGCGTSLLMLNRYEDAAACFERAILLDADYVEAHLGLGTALQRLKAYEKAVQSYKIAVELAPDLVDAHVSLGTVLNDCKHYREAVLVFEQALELDAQNEQAHTGLGNALEATDHPAMALAHFEKALNAHPNSANAELNFGTVLEQLGRLDEARAAFERAFRIAPYQPRICYALIRSGPVKPGDPHLERLEQIVREVEAIAPDELAIAHFALGKAYSDLGRPADGFQQYIAGNAIRRSNSTYDERATEAAFDRIVSSFSLQRMRSLSGTGFRSNLPVFIVGMPRSGSTLVEQIISSHPEVAAGGERSDFGLVVKSAGIAVEASDFGKRVESLQQNELQSIGEAYVSRLNAWAHARNQQGKVRITDKMLANFWFLGLIHLVLPNARIIHTHRSPVDTCLSCFSTYFEQPFAYDLAELGRYCRLYSEMMSHWYDVLPQGLILNVQYENLVQDFEHHARAIIAHCGLLWNDACLSFEQNVRPVRTASVRQVRTTLYRGSLQRWRPDDSTIQPLLDGLGSALR